LPPKILSDGVMAAQEILVLLV